NVTPSRWGEDRLGRPADQVGRRRFPVAPVADPPHSHHLERGARRELLAQPADVHVDRLAVTGELAAPHVLEQRVARMDASWEGEQVRDEVELAGGQFDVDAIKDHAPRGTIDAEVPYRVLFGNRLRLVGFRLRPAEDRMHSREDLADRERFGDVIVGAKLESNDLVDL